MSLIALEQAKKQLGIADDDWSRDGEVQDLLESAEAAVIGFVNPPLAVAWTEDTLPQQARRAMLVLLTHLDQNRGDDMKADAEVWEAIKRLLVPVGLRDPALA